MPTLLIVSGVQFAVLATLAVLRTANNDEGYYLLASRLAVDEGRQPYVDFFFTQMPLLPYVYGAWMKIFGFTWYSGRLLSALIATGLGVLIFVYVERTFRSRRLAWVGVFLFATSAFTLSWNTVVMTYPLSEGLLFAAFVVLSLGGRSWRYALSGLLLGLGIESRLLVAAAVPAFLVGIWLETKQPRSLLLWLGGLAFGLLPAAWFALVAREAFFFGNVGFHALRNSAGFIGGWSQKAEIAAELLNLRSAGGETITFQVPLLLGLNVYYVVLLMRRRVPLTIAFMATILLAIALLLPTPTYSLYFTVLLPFVIINCLYALHAAIQDIGALPGREHFSIALGVFLAFYASIVPVVIYKYTSWLGPPIAGLHNVDPRARSLPEIRRVSKAIDRLAQPGAPVLSWWPGYLFESHAAPLPGTENNGWLEIGDIGADGARLRVATRSAVDAAIAQHHPGLVVFGIIAPEAFRDRVSDRYLLLESLDAAELYVPRP